MRPRGVVGMLVVLGLGVARAALAQDVECPVAQIGQPCTGGTCIEASCCDNSAGCTASSSGGSSGTTGTPRACGFCTYAGGAPYCSNADVGLPCGDGGMCSYMGAGYNLPGIPALGGGTTSVSFTFTACMEAPPPGDGGLGSSSGVGGSSASSTSSSGVGSTSSSSGSSSGTSSSGSSGGSGSASGGGSGSSAGGSSGGTNGSSSGGTGSSSGSSSGGAGTSSSDAGDDAGVRASSGAVDDSGSGSGSDASPPGDDGGGVSPGVPAGCRCTTALGVPDGAGQPGLLLALGAMTLLEARRRAKRRQ